MFDENYYLELLKSGSIENEKDLYFRIDREFWRMSFTQMEEFIKRYDYANYKDKKMALIYTTAIKNAKHKIFGIFESDFKRNKEVEI